MMGRSHIITGACALEHVYVVSVLIEKADIMPLTMVQQIFQSYLGITESSLVSVIMVPAYLAVYFIGTLLPDIDNPRSLLGRIVHIPVRHRTWLHAIYVYLVIGALGFMYPICAWLFLGVFVHLFWDSFSANGTCWFYKLFSDYREYPGGARVKKGHKLKLYHAGEWSEYLLLFIIVAATVGSYIWIMR